MRKLTLLTLLLMLCAVLTQAQNITGTVKDDQGKNLSGATVALKKVKDSAVVKLGVTNLRSVQFYRCQFRPVFC